jgi:serine/threonine protein kinase
VCRVARETIEIIEALHARGTVHCDIKPDNFLLNQVSVSGFVLVNMWHERETINSSLSTNVFVAPG